MNQRIVIIAALLALLLATGGFAQDAETAPKKETLTPEQAGSYSLGVQFGKRLEPMRGEIDRAMVFRGIEDALDSKPLLMSEEEVRKEIEAFARNTQMRQAEQMRELMAKNKAAQEAFLAENKTKQGITTLESGLQYKVIKAGDGGTPSATDRVKFRYTGRLLDGTVFDSSERYGDAKISQVNKIVLKGMREALALMKEGDKWELYVPSSLGYGTQPVPKAGPNQLLVVEIELLEILPPAETPAPAPAAPPGAVIRR